MSSQIDQRLHVSLDTTICPEMPITRMAHTQHDSKSLQSIQLPGGWSYATFLPLQ